MIVSIDASLPSITLLDDFFAIVINNFINNASMYAAADDRDVTAEIILIERAYYYHDIIRMSLRHCHTAFDIVILCLSLPHNFR